MKSKRILKQDASRPSPGLTAGQRLSRWGKRQAESLVGWREIGTGAAYLSTLAGQWLAKRQCRSSRRETWTEAVQRLGLTSNSLRQRYQELQSQFWLGVAIAGLGIWFGVALPSFSHGNYRIARALIGVLVAMLGLTYAAPASLRCWQIRHRTLGGVQRWLRQGPWIPHQLPFDWSTESRHTGIEES